MELQKPGFSIPRYKDIYNRISGVVRKHSEQTIDLNIQTELMNDIEKALPLREEEISTNRILFIHSVLNRYQDEILTSQLIHRLSLIMAGCEKEMEKGIRYREWELSDKPIWAALYMDTAEPVKARGRLYRCILDSYSGLSASRRLSVTLPGGFLQHMIRSCGGHKFGDYEDVDAGGLWMTAVMGEYRRRMRFEEIHVSHSQEKHNKQILKARSKECIKDIFKNRCINCYLGRNECYLARHSRRYQKGICRNTENVGEHKGYIVDKGYCLHCLTKRLV